jgi:hypothetical protein
MSYYTLEWSDRQVEVAASNLEDLTDAVIKCALDHAYDRTETGVPYGLPLELRDVLAAIVERHLAAKRADWREHTVEMSGEELERLRGELLEALQTAGKSP